MDTHWNPSNAIYGDNPVKTSRAEDCESFYPSINAIVQSTNLYVYCGNNPISYEDSTGMWMRPGYFHDMVVNEVENMYSLSSERWVTNGSKLIGRVDLVDLETGEVWEVKPVKYIDAGVLQLESYVHNHLVTDLSLDLIRGNARISTGQIDEGQYIIRYWYARDGVIAYVPVKKQANKKDVVVNEQISQSAIMTMAALGLSMLIYKALDYYDSLATKKAW